MRRELLLGLACLSACTARGPRGIALGEEPCTHCHMTVTDPRFAAEAITRTGQVMIFDDVGCLAAWLKEGDRPRSIWVANFSAPGQWLPADSALYLDVPSLRTPMSSGLAAIPPTSADSLRAVLGGELIHWDEARNRGHKAGATS